jgi:hypothetical protein
MIPGFQVSGIKGTRVPCNKNLESRVPVEPFGVSVCSLRWSHGVRIRGAKELVNPISSFDTSRDREPGRARTQKSRNAKAGSAFLVRPTVIANDHIKKDKGMDGLR